MASEVTVTEKFQNQALTVIWDEIQVMLESDAKAIGVAFDEPSSARGSIWVSYVYRGHLIGQKQQHPQLLWRDICFSMRVIGRLWVVNNNGEERIVKLHEGVMSGSRWTICPQHNSDPSLTMLEKIFHRVDEVLKLLAEPLLEPQS